MRQKTMNLQNQVSFDKKIRFFFPDPKSHNQEGSLSAKNLSEKFSRLGTFKSVRDSIAIIWLWILIRIVTYKNAEII